MEKKLTSKEKTNLLIAILTGLDIGGVLGIIAYHQQWLG